MHVVGSDDCSNWSMLLVVENTGFTFSKKPESRKWIIPEENRREFSCIGLRWPNESPRVMEILMWEES